MTTPTPCPRCDSEPCCCCTDPACQDCHPLPDPHEAMCALRELIAWGASAPSPEDVADDVTDYVRWLERRPAAATRQAALDALAQAAQGDGQYDPPKEPT